MKTAAVIGLSLLLAGCALTERAAGRAEARRDIAGGHLRLRTFGMPVPSDEVYRRLAAERLGVEIEHVAGCVVTSRLVARTEGYNDVVRAEIERRFGAGALDALSAEAARMPAERKP